MQFRSVKQRGKVSAGIKVESVSFSLGHSEEEWKLSDFGSLKGQCWTFNIKLFQAVNWFLYLSMLKGYNNQIVQTDGQPGTIWHGAERPEQAGISAGPADQTDLSLLCFPLVRRTEQDTQQIRHELFCQDALAEKCNTTLRIPLIWLS